MNVIPASTKYLHELRIIKEREAFNKVEEVKVEEIKEEPKVVESETTETKSA